MKDTATIVYGAGVSGKGAAEVLAKHGKKVFLYNDNCCSLPEKLEMLLEKQGGGLVCGPELFPKLLEEADQLVLSPGIPCDNVNILRAEAEGIEVISEIELGYRCYGGHIAAITGTNGKTTTTSLVGEMFKHLQVPSAIGGNIGLALSKEVEGLTKESWLAAELSSFQLEKIKNFCPDIAVMLNLTPDHLERHHTMEAYGAAKQQIFRNQTAEQITVLNYDDPIVRSWAKNTKGQVCFFSRTKELEQGVYVHDGSFVIKWKNCYTTVCGVKEAKLFGGHNVENMLAAIACGFFAGVSIEAMRQVLKSFRAIEHRIEYVATINQVPYYNDSKATNTDSTIKALEAFEDGHIILLAGGHDKLTELAPMMRLVKEKVETLILLGEAKERFHAAAIAAGVDNILVVESFEEAVKKAYAIARKPQVVLLSPACSSYDMFNNYPERGNRFKELVHKLVH